MQDPVPQSSGHFSLFAAGKDGVNRVEVKNARALRDGRNEGVMDEGIWEVCEGRIWAKRSEARYSLVSCPRILGGVQRAKRGESCGSAKESIWFHHHPIDCRVQN